jgi:hypothetical protein
MLLLLLLLLLLAAATATPQAGQASQWAVALTARSDSTQPHLRRATKLQRQKERRRKREGGRTE